jgi:transposase
VHRKRSQVAVVTEDGAVQLNRNVVNGSEPVLKLIGGLPAGTPVAFEAAFGWGWLVELLENYGFTPHLVHPSRCKAIAFARLKNDKAGAAILAQLLRADLLPEAWIAPPPVRQLRALLRHRVSYPPQSRFSPSSPAASSAESSAWSPWPSNIPPAHAG